MGLSRSLLPLISKKRALLLFVTGNLLEIQDRIGEDYPLITASRVSSPLDWFISCCTCSDMFCQIVCKETAFIVTPWFNLL